MPHAVALGMPNVPPRCPDFPYVGMHRYFLTACTSKRVPAFARMPFTATCQAHLLRCADRAGFAVPAYCFMPDHVHVLLEATHPEAALLPCWKTWRQVTARVWALSTSGRLWQKGYWDHILREADETLPFAAYLVHNPVRAGLVVSPAEYPWLGSSLYSMEQLLTAVQMAPPGRRRGRSN